MEEKNVVKFKKEEFAIKEFIKSSLGRGKISKVKIEYTPIGEKVIISTHKPGLIIGRGGERIGELTKILKTKFNLENPRVDIENINHPEFDAQITADEIARGLERFGPLRFKVIAYRTLQRIIDAKALGAEIRLSGKLPGARAKSWRFSQGYLKKAGESANVVDNAQSRAETKPGTVGIKVGILAPDVLLKDKIVVNEELIEKLKANSQFKEILKKSNVKRSKNNEN